MERVRVLDAVQMVLDYTKGLDPSYDPAVQTQPDMPTGPYNRVAENSLAKELLGWEPKSDFATGLRKTMDWYFGSKDQEQVAAIFGHMLTGRGSASDPALVQVGAVEKSTGTD
jgi:dTDP-D-glucose 4,6-dehydratase